MQKMKKEYAQRILDGGYAFGNSFLSCHDNLLVVEVDEDDYPYQNYFAGTMLVNGELQTDEEGFVVFKRVDPVIESNTRFRFP